MKIRQAKDSDVAAICGIWNPMIRDTLFTFTTDEKTRPQMRQMLAEREANDLPFLVAKRGGAVMGFATYGPFRGGPGYAHTMEHSIVVSGAAQGGGVGRALLDALEQHAAKRNIHSLIAGISGENPAAIQFHIRCGFHHIARVPQVGRKFDQWLDLILLQKFL